MLKTAEIATQVTLEAVQDPHLGQALGAIMAHPMDPPRQMLEVGFPKTTSKITKTTMTPAEK